MSLGRVPEPGTNLVKMNMVIFLPVLTVFWMYGRINSLSCWFYMGLIVLGRLKYTWLNH